MAAPRESGSLPVSPLAGRALLFLVGLATAPLMACGAAGETEGGGLTYELSIVPDPPQVGLAQLELRVADAAGAPVEGATIRIEGNMNHAGMVHEFADARETEPGLYAAELEFTMGGDWILSVETTTADGGADRWRRDVRGVGAN